MNDNVVLKVEDLWKDFPTGSGVVHAVNGVTFEVLRGETFALVGESGSGKTTTGRCVLKLIEPTKGRMVFAGVDITSLSQAGFRKLRHKVQMVFQEPHAALNRRLTVGTIVEEPLLFGPPMGRPLSASIDGQCSSADGDCAGHRDVTRACDLGRAYFFARRLRPCRDDRSTGFAPPPDEHSLLVHYTRLNCGAHDS